jgi:hypothetical protein
VCATQWHSRQSVPIQTSALDITASLVAAISQIYHEEFEGRETHVIISSLQMVYSYISCLDFITLPQVLQSQKQNNKEEWTLSQSV